MHHTGKHVPNHGEVEGLRDGGGARGYSYCIVAVVSHSTRVCAHGFQTSRTHPAEAHHEHSGPVLSSAHRPCGLLRNDFARDDTVSEFRRTTRPNFLVSGISSGLLSWRLGKVLSIVMVTFRRSSRLMLMLLQRRKGKRQRRSRRRNGKGWGGATSPKRPPLTQGCNEPLSR